MTFSEQTQRMVANVLLFNIGWFACVLGGDRIALLTMLVIVALHLRYVARLPGEWRLLVQIATLGFAFDSILLASGVLILQGYERTAPLWMICLWPLFATLLLNSLQWLQRYWYLVPLVGALAGPPSYYAGSSLSPVNLMSPQWQAIAYLALAWALLLPLLVWMAYLIRERVRD